MEFKLDRGQAREGGEGWVEARVLLSRLFWVHLE